MTHFYLTVLFSIFGVLVFAFKRFYYRPEENWLKDDTTLIRPVEPNITEPAPSSPSELLWDTPAHVKHSVRVICDEEGLTLEQKNTMCATIGGESEYNTKAINRNYVIKNGVRTLASTDFGLCQWNDYFHAKEITPDEALHEPEKAVRLMCDYWKRGQRTLWIAYKNGRYLRFM